MKKKRVALIIVCIIIAIMAMVVWWQFENIKSVYFYFKYSAEDIDTMIQDSNKEVEEYLEKNTNIQVRPTEDVEEKLHQAGVITDEELTMLIMGQTTIEDLFGTGISINEKKQFVRLQNGEVVNAEILKKMKAEVAGNRTNGLESNDDQISSGDQKDNSKNTGVSESFVNTSENEDADDDRTTAKESPTGQGKDTIQNVGTDSSQTEGMAQVSQYVAQMYVLKSTFSGELSSLYSQAIASYEALPASQRNENGKNTIIKELYPKAAALEKSCDTKVSSLLKELEALLVEQGESTELVTKMRNAYYQEKSLVKAQYMNEL